MKRAYTIAMIAVIGGVLLHLMVLLVIQVEMPSVRRTPSEPSTVRFLGELDRSTSDSVIEQAALQDSAPLFMPTSWNSASNMSQVASLQSATRIFDPYPAQLTLTAARPAVPVASDPLTSEQTTRLPDGPAFYLARLGRKAPTKVNAVSPGPSVRVRRMSSAQGNSGPARQLPARLATSAPQSLWNPVKMYFQLKNGMPVGLPLLSQSSGFADWDTSLQQYFLELEFYHPFDDGYFQIWVYP